MKIGFVWDGNYPWDVRVEKICLSLIEASHEVHMVCRNGRYEPYEEVIDGIHIHRLPVIKGSGFLNSIVNFPFFFNPVWYYKICNLLERENINIVIVRDITLSLTTLKAARGRGIPVILDMAEPYPEMIRAQHTFEKISLKEKIVRNVKVSEWVEKKTLDEVSLVFAMVEESRDRMIGMSIPQEKILIVSNTPMASQVRESHSNPSPMDRFKGRTIFLYIGFLNMYRGIQIAVQAMPTLLEKDGKAILVVVGSGGCEAELKSLSRKLGVEKNVFLKATSTIQRLGIM